MSNTEAVNEKTEELVPVGEIKPFFLSDGAFGRVLDGYPDTYLPKAAIPYILQESHFIEDPEQKQEEWPRALAEAMGKGQECPYCANSLEVEHNRLGPVTGIRVVQSIDCRCRVYRNFYSRWFNPSNVSKDYRHVHMGKLESLYRNFGKFQYDPDNRNAPSAFKTLLDTVREYKDNCYLLTGKAGTGKTTLLTAMYHRALKDWTIQAFEDERGRGIECVWKVNANTLAKQQRDWTLRDEGRDADTGLPAILPTVTKNKVMEAVRHGLVPHLFLDEFDKIKLDSSFQLNEFSEVIDAIQSNGGQVVACTNLPILALKHALGNQHGEAIIRRLVGPRMNPKKPDEPADPTVGGFLVDCTAGTITQNYQLPSTPVPVQATIIKGETGPAYQRKATNSNSGATQARTAVPPPPSPAASTFSSTRSKGSFAFDGSRVHKRSH